MCQYEQKWRVLRKYFCVIRKNQTIECCLKWHFFKKIFSYAKRLRCGVVILRRKFEITAAQWKKLYTEYISEKRLKNSLLRIWQIEWKFVILQPILRDINKLQQCRNRELTYWKAQDFKVQIALRDIVTCSFRAPGPHAYMLTFWIMREDNIIT